MRRRNTKIKNTNRKSIRKNMTMKIDTSPQTDRINILKIGTAWWFMNTTRSNIVTAAALQA